MARLLFAITALIVFWGDSVLAQQVPDTLFSPTLPRPAYQQGVGPVVLVDAAHHNFHTIDGRFKPFALLLRRDGYVVKTNGDKFSAETLAKARILVISNALHVSNTENWSLPTPSAFTDQEIKAVVEWVRAGGSLFLIADHMPFPGNNEKLAAAFGFKFYNGFAFDTSKDMVPDLFAKANRRLRESPVTSGIDSIYTFTGQGFDVPADATPVLVFDHHFQLWLPETAWEFGSTTTKISAGGKCQGAVLNFGQGRVSVFGEAAMFSAQVAGDGSKMGFNHPAATHNPAFLLNVIHWLDSSPKRPGK